MLINPKPEIVENSYIKDYEKLYEESIENPEAFWDKIAKELFWFKPWDKVLEWKYPYARWFVGGQTNIVYNCLDRWLKTPTADKTALIWVGQDMNERKFTYKQLNDEVCKFANGLKSLGLKKGDHVTIYLPRVPEQDITMLACAKIGLVHSVVFSGFSVEALKNRLIDAKSKVVVCTNAYPYKDKIIESKKNVDEAIKDCPTVKHIIVVKRIATGRGEDTSFSRLGMPRAESRGGPTGAEKDGIEPTRDIWWHDLVAHQDTICSTAIMESTDPLYILYTSGSTGKPKGVVHDHGGYMVGTYITLKWVFNLQPDDIYFCTADAGWVTGHSYIVYSPLLNGITSFIYEGTPDYPHPGIWWSLIEKYKITKFYTAPTAIRALMRLGDDWPNKYNLNSLKILGSVGEPINPEAWLWYYKAIGKKRCPIMDTWWQTETGMFILTPLPSVPLKPGSCFKPFPGIKVDVVDSKGHSLITQLNNTKIISAKDTDSQPMSRVAANLMDNAIFTSLMHGREDVSERFEKDNRQDPQTNKQGFLVIKTPWPAMLLDVYNNPKKYLETYFENEAIENKKSRPKVDRPLGEKLKDEEAKISVSNDLGGAQPDFSRESTPTEVRNTVSSFEGFMYFTGDSAKYDEDGYYWIIGRNDDVIKVSGHRLGSAELESAFVSHPSVAEAAVIGKPDEIKGEKIKAFVILKQGFSPSDELKKELVQQVRKMIGPIATPDEIEFVDKLPKTRSGKIMRRVLKAQELSQPLGDTSTLES